MSLSRRAGGLHSRPHSALWLLLCPLPVFLPVVSGLRGNGRGSACPALLVVLIPVHAGIGIVCHPAALLSMPVLVSDRSADLGNRTALDWSRIWFLDPAFP